MFLGQSKYFIASDWDKGIIWFIVIIEAIKYFGCLKNIFCYFNKTFVDSIKNIDC